MPKYILDPEFKAVNRALTSEEFAALRDKVRAEGPKEPLWLGSGPLSETLLDGYNRTAIYDELQIFDFPVTHAPVETREAAVDWIIDHQLSRRNLNREERDYLIGKRYLREKAQGKAGGGKTTAERLADAEGLSEKTVRRAAEFTQAVDAIAENVGEGARQEIRQGTARIPAQAVSEIAKQPPAKQAEVYAAAKGTKGKSGKYVMPERDRPRGPNLLAVLGQLVGFTPAAARKYVVEHPDEATKLRDCARSARSVLEVLSPAPPARELAADWNGDLPPDPPDPLVYAAEWLRDHPIEAPGWLVDQIGPKGALDFMERLQHALKVHVEVAAEDLPLRPTAEQVAAAQALERANVAALEQAIRAAVPETADDLAAFARRVADAMGDQTQRSFATRLGVTVPTLRKVLDGKPVRADSRRQIEAKLG